jgi:hypothetical protein
VRLSFLARPRGSGESVIAVELAYDLDDTIDGLEIRTRFGGVHRAERHEQRFVETADLKGEEFGWGLRHTLREDVANDVAHPLERKTSLAAISGTEAPRLRRPTIRSSR